jgi:shikimate kinase
LQKRLASESQRPSITGKDPIDELETLWQSRKPVYDANADLTIDVENKTIQEIVEEIWTKS